jgi:hypothetical protein
MDGEGNEEFGFERRTGSALSITVDPSDVARVVVAWGDSIDGSRQTLHVRQSKDGGQTWSLDLFSVRNATNPTLAFDGFGRIGFSYQRLVNTENGRFWETHFLLTADNFASIRDFTLAKAPAQPADGNVPYMGDYMDLMARGDTFYGVFSTVDDPALTEFPFGVQRSRRVVLNKLRPPTGMAEVLPSMDPFFFKVRIAP